MLEFLQQPMPWYVAGPLIGLLVPLLLISSNKQFGISSTFRHICAACIPLKPTYFQYDWKSEIWSLILIAGVIAGSFVGGVVFRNPDPVQISESTVTHLKEFGISDFSGLVPSEIFDWNKLMNLVPFLMIIVGGFLVGFGTRYANGCTSGHAIMGLSLLSWRSLIAVISFFAGGLIMTHFIFPFIF